MNQLAAMLAPLILLLPGATAVISVSGADTDREAPVVATAPDAGLAMPAARPDAIAADAFEGLAFALIAQSFLPQIQDQVRIEQRMTIRIAPRAPAPQTMLLDLPRAGLAPRYEEKHMGRCVPITGIAGVQVGEGNRLLLFMRDQRIVSAELEKSCRPRDFYSGFYVDRTGDGMLCADRDMLHSRSGTDCSLKRFRQLVEADD